MAEENPRKKLGFIHVCTGTGGCVHEASMGYALRAIGHGLRVLMVEFLKEKIERGEHRSAKLLFPHFQILSFHPIEPSVPDVWTPADRACVNEAMNVIRQIIQKKDHPDIVILNDINRLIAHDVLPWSGVIDLIENGPSHIEWMLTGHPVHEHIKKHAHFVTEMNPKKAVDGIHVRKGIDY